MEINNQIVEIPESASSYVLIVHRKGFRRTRGAWPFGRHSAQRRRRKGEITVIDTEQRYFNSTFWIHGLSDRRASARLRESRVASYDGPSCPTVRTQKAEDEPPL
jgi:hypothetical protein